MLVVLTAVGPHLRLTAMLVVLLALAACGGGGGGRTCTAFGVLVDPFCVPADQPSEGSTLSIFDLRGKTESSTRFNALETQIERDGTQASTVGPEVGRITITPGGPDDSILVILPFQTALTSNFRLTTWDKSERVDALGGTFDRFETGSVEGGSFSTFTLLNTDFGGSGLDYTTYGIWESSTYDIASGALLTNRATAAVFGFPTPATDMPSTGSATYNGRMDGNFSDSLGLSQPVNGAVALTADFATTDISLGMTGVTVGGQPFRDFSGTGSITNDSFVGTDNLFVGGFTGLIATDPIRAGQVGPDMEGSFQGNFFGPAADEIGGVFEMDGGGAVMSGAFVGAQ